MNNDSKKMLFLLAAFFVLVLSLGTSTTSDTLKERGTHKVKFFDEKTFNEGVDKAKGSIQPLAYHVSGGIVPHHLFVSFIIADFFHRLSLQNPQTIILLGPNHYEKGNFKALTGLYNWDTPFGLVSPDDRIISNLSEHNLVKVDEETLSNDQSLSSIMPFVKYYLPNVKVVPILLSGGLTKDESEVLANSLSDLITKDVIVIASVDFSHYLTSAQAKERDETTLQVLKEFNYRELYLLNNDYLDSPPSIGVLLMIMQRLGTTKMDLLFHTNSGELQNDEYIQTTSYFSITYQSFIPKTPTLEQVFSSDHSWVTALPVKRIRIMIATGDVIPARSVNFQASRRKDFKWPYLKVSDVLKNADITFINLETPLIDNCPATQEGMIFCGNAGNVEGLIFSGVDIASLANNHAGNYGAAAVDKTKELLNNNGIVVTGINGAEYINVRGVKFAFLGYNDITKPQPGISNVEEEKIKRDILETKQKADVVIVTYHWGVEYRDQPDDRQKYLGHLAIDAGADLVIGNHPHWIQPIEIYRGKLITYTHGNFVFDQEWSLKTKQGVVGKYTFYDNQLIDVEYLPVLIENYGQPHFLIGSDKNVILQNMKVQSERLSSLSN